MDAHESQGYTPGLRGYYGLGLCPLLQFYCFRGGLYLHIEDGDVLMVLAGDGKRKVQDHSFLGDDADVVVIDREWFLAVGL